MREVMDQQLLMAANGFGKYCPARHELLVRKGKKTQRFIFGESKIRVVTHAKKEITFFVAPDVTVQEIRRFIATMTATMER